MTSLHTQEQQEEKMKALCMQVKNVLESYDELMACPMKNWDANFAMHKHHMQNLKALHDEAIVCNVSIKEHANITREAGS